MPHVAFKFIFSIFLFFLFFKINILLCHMSLSVHSCISIKISIPKGVVTYEKSTGQIFATYEKNT